MDEKKQNNNKSYFYRTGLTKQDEVGDFFTLVSMKSPHYRILLIYLKIIVQHVCFCERLEDIRETGKDTLKYMQFFRKSRIFSSVATTSGPRRILPPTCWLLLEWPKKISRGFFFNCKSIFKRKRVG